MTVLHLEVKVSSNNSSHNTKLLVYRLPGSTNGSKQTKAEAETHTVSVGARSCIGLLSFANGFCLDQPSCSRMEPGSSLELVSIGIPLRQSMQQLLKTET